MKGFCCPNPLESGCITLLALMFDNMHSILPATEAHLSFSIQLLLELHYVGMIDCPCGWSQSLSRLIPYYLKLTTNTHPNSHCWSSWHGHPHPKTIQVWSTSTLNHIFKTTHMTQGPQTNKDIPIRNTSKSPDITSRKLRAKARPSLWARLSSLLRRGPYTVKKKRERVHFLSSVSHSA